MSILKDADLNPLLSTHIIVAETVVDNVTQTLTALENTGKEVDLRNTAESSDEGDSSSRGFGNNETNEDDEEQEEEDIPLKDKNKENENNKGKYHSYNPSQLRMIVANHVYTIKKQVTTNAKQKKKIEKLEEEKGKFKGDKDKWILRKENLTYELKHLKGRMKDTEKQTKDRMKEMEVLIIEDRVNTKAISNNMIENLKQQMETKNITITNQNMMLKNYNKQIKEDKDLLFKIETDYKKKNKKLFQDLDSLAIKKNDIERAYHCEIENTRAYKVTIKNLETRISNFKAMELDLKLQTKKAENERLAIKKEDRRLEQIQARRAKDKESNAFKEK